MSVMLRAHFVKAGRPEKHWQAGAAVGSERRVLSNSGQFLLDLFSRLGTGEANMSYSRRSALCSLLALPLILMPRSCWKYSPKPRRC